MKLVIPPVEIDEADPFKNDVLKRKEFADRLLNLISRAKDEGLVLSIDAAWGEGKTTFVRMWHGLLRSAGFKSVYFDAFANDYVDDPFVAVASEITSLAESPLKADARKKKSLQRFKKSASKVGAQLLPLAARIGVKAATLGLIEDAHIEAIKGIKDDLAKGASDLAGKLIEKSISEYKQKVQSIATFRETLEALATDISEGSGKPLVIIIDELDRCKPTYAVDLIEKIKHLFSVRKIVFILVMHKAQLEEAVRSVYGQNIDANTYLQKFINMECSLPKNTERHQIDDYKAYCNHLYNLHELKNLVRRDHVADSVAAISRNLGLSLRQIERVFNLITIFYGSTTERTLRLVHVVVPLAVLKVIDSRLFSRLKDKKVTYEEVHGVLGLPQAAPNASETWNLYQIGQWLRFCLLSAKDYDLLDKDDDLRSFGQHIVNYSIERSNIIPLYCDWMNIGKLN